MEVQALRTQLINCINDPLNTCSPLCVALYEWTILFKFLGKTLSMVFYDITEKVVIMRYRSFGANIFFKYLERYHSESVF